ncbi:MAG: hypothetical protein IKL03_04280 [Bacteroidaceae bacterium]|nr:hypothetical protein [Bacteroidaceae bacterium]
MKRLLTLMLGLGLAMAGWAEEEPKMYSHVYLKLHDGNTYEIPIEHGSQIYSYARGTGKNTYFVVDVTGKDCYYQFRREEIAVMKLVEDTVTHTDIDVVPEELPVMDDAHQSKLHYRQGELLAHHTLDGELLIIADIRGRQVYAARVEAPFALDLGFLPEGIYIAKVNEHTLKIRK